MSLPCSPFLPSILAMLFDRDLSLTVLCLCCSLCLHPKYSKFRNRLDELLPLPDVSTLPTTDDEAFNAALKVLQMERKAVVVVEDRGKMGNDTRAVATDQDRTMADYVGQPQAPVDKVDNALEILVRNATEEFGFIPRDVYNGVFKLPWTRDEHAAAVKGLRCSELTSLVKAFSEQRALHGPSHKVAVVYPDESFAHYDLWGINFKSVQIAGEVIGSMRLEEDKHLRKAYTFLREFPEGSTLAGWIFEVIAHRVLPGGWSKGPALRQIRMTSDLP